MSVFAVSIGDAFKLGGKSMPGVFSTLSSLINVLLPNIFLLSGLIAFLFLIFGGVIVIVNAGNAEKTKQGSQIITASLAGLVLILVSYWLIQIVSILTGIPVLNPGF